MAGLPKIRWSTTIRSAEEVLSFCRSAAEFLRSVNDLQILNGQFITASFAAAASVNARHQLGRAYRGVIVVRTSDATATPAVSVIPAADALAAGGDPASYVALGATSAFTADVTLWVF